MAQTSDDAAKAGLVNLAGFFVRPSEVAAVYERAGGWAEIRLNGGGPPYAVVMQVEEVLAALAAVRHGEEQRMRAQRI